MSDFRIHGVIDADARRFQTTIAGVLKSFGDLRTAQEKTAVSSRVLERQTRDLNRALEQQNAQLTALVLNFRAARNAMLSLALTFAIAGFRGLAASVAAVGVGLVELTQQAVKLGGALGVLGTAGLAAIGQGALVAVLGLKGLSKAFTTTGTDHEKAMAKLTAPARQFVGQLKDMQMAFREVKLLAQQGLFDGVVKGVRAAMPLLEPLKQVVYDTATAMGYLADRVGTLVGQRASDLKAFGERNVITLRRMGDAAINLGDAFLQVMRAADPFIGHVTRGIVTLSKSLETAAITARRNGGLGSFFADMQKSWDVWTSTFGNVARGLLNIFQTVNGPANSVADAIHRASADFLTWTRTTSSQQGLQRFFENSNRVLGSMAAFTGQLAKDLAGLAVGPGAASAVAFFDLLRVHVLPTLNDLAIQFDKGLFANLVQFTAAFSDFIRAALPGLAPVAAAMGKLVTALSHLLQFTTPLIQQLPGITKLVAAFAIGGGVLGAWSKLADLMGLAFLRARMLVGLAPEMAGFGAVTSQILLRGGRNQAGAVGGAVAAGGRGGGGGAVFASGGGLGGGGVRPRSASTLPYLQPGRVTFDARTANALEREMKDLEQLSGVMSIGASGARDKNTGRFIPNSRYGATGAATAAYRDFQSIDLTGKGKFTKFADQVGAATHAGIAKGLGLAKPIIGATFGFAAVNGMLSFLASNQHVFRNRMQDMFSGLTFGFLDTADEKMAKNASKLAGILKGGTVDFSKLGQKFDLGLALRKGGLDPKLLQTKFSVDSQKGLSALKQVTDALHKTGQISDDVAQKFQDMGTKMSQGLRRAQVKEWTDEVQRNWSAMARDSQGRLADIRHTVELNTTIIKQRLGSDTRAGQVALAGNFKAAAAAIKKAMSDGTISVKTGTAAIHDAMVKALQQLGFTGQQADQKAGSGVRHGQVLQNPGARQPGQNAPGGAAARGMLQTLPGTPGRDSVPLQVGAQKIVAAPGEDVAVVNRHQRKVLDQRLGDVGGFAGLFRNVRTPHGQNEVKGYASGGIVSGGSSVFDRIAQAASAIDARHYPYQWGGGHNSSFSGPYDCSGAWSAILHAAGLLNAPETSGQFMSYGLPGPGTVTLYASPKHVYGSIAGKFWGTSGANPGGGAGFFPGGPRPGFTVRHVPQQLLGKIGDMLGLGSGAGPMLKRVLATDPGMLGQLEQTALDKDLGAAQSKVDAAAAAMSSSVGGGQFGGGDLPEGGSAAANMAIAKSMAKSMFGWTGALWNDLAKLGNQESGWRTTARNPSSGAFGIGQFLGKTRDAYAKFGANSSSAGEQINAMLHYIHDRYGSPAGAWAHEQSAGWYERGGIVDALFASAGQPPIPGRGGGHPNPSPSGAVTPGSKGGNNTNGKPKPKKKPTHKKPPKPFAGHHPLPNTAGIKGDKPKAKARKKHKGKEFYPKLHGGSDVAEALLKAALPDYDALFENPINTANNLLTNLAGQADLTDEEAIVTLFDSGSYADLSAFWAAHPDLAKTYQGQVDSFDVVNAGGMNVQGKFTPGIAQHMGELIQQVGVHTGSPDPSAQGGLVGKMLAYVQSITGKGIPAATHLRAQAVSELKRLHTHWNMWHGRRAHDNAEIAKLSSGGRSWQQRVSDNQARVKVLQDYKRQVHADAVGHRLTQQDQSNLNKADQEIANLNSDSQHLRSAKPAPKLAHEKKAERAHRLRVIAHLRSDRDEALLRMDELAASRENWNTDGGLAKDWTDRISTYTTSISDQTSKLTDLQQVRVPAEQLAVAGIAKEMGDWSGTSVPLPKIDAGASDQQQALADLLKQQNDQLLQKLALANSEKEIFAGFAPLLAKSLVGVFEHGGVVPRTGLALVHENETIIPDPRGPYGNSAAAALAGGRGGNMSVHLHGDLAPLMKLIDARIDGRAPKLVDRKLGRDGRSLHFAPGG